MIRKKLTLLFAALMVAGLVLGPARITDAAQRHYTQDNCIGLEPATYDLRHDATTFYNATATARTAFCPMMDGEDASSADPTSAFVDTTDSSSTLDLYCYLSARSDAGTWYDSSILYTCGTAGGCTVGARDTSWWGGNGYLQWTNPLNGGAAISGDLWQLHFVCSMPGTSGNSGAIRHYEVTY